MASCDPANVEAAAAHIKAPVSTGIPPCRLTSRWLSEQLALLVAIVLGECWLRLQQVCRHVRLVLHRTALGCRILLTLALPHLLSCLVLGINLSLQTTM
jgi:hypothetical protein